MKSRNNTTIGVRSRKYVNNTPLLTDIVAYRDFLSVSGQSSGPIPKPLKPNAFAYDKLESYALTGTLTEFKATNSYFVTSGLCYDALSISSVRTLPMPDKATVYNECLDKFNQATRGSLDLSVSAFEWKQSVQLARNLSPKGLMNLSSQIYDTYIRRPLKSRGRWNSRHVNGDMYGQARIPADLWLQYQYGLRPLMQDVFDTALEAVRYVDTSLNLIETSVRKPFGGDIKHNWLITGTSPNVFNGIRGCKGARICKISAQLQNDALASSNVSRFTSMNPASIAWELIPYSFVVDWFVDVGSYLRSVETALLSNNTFKSGYISELVYYEGQPEMAWSNQLIDSYLYNGKVTGNIHYASFQRRVLSSYPLPAVPRFKTDLGSSQLLSAAALLTRFLPKEVLPMTLNQMLPGARTSKGSFVF